MNPIFAILQAALGPLLGIIDKSVKDKDLAVKLKAELTSQMLTANSDVAKSASNIIVAEAKGESWMQRNWRPLTMLCFVFIIVNNYVIAPYAQAFGWTVPTLAIPPGMWALLQLGIGGYIASRGIEKSVKLAAPAIAARAASKPQMTQADLIQSLNGGGR